MTKKTNLELRKEWEQRIADHKSSGLSQAKWCEENGMTVGSGSLSHFPLHRNLICKIINHSSYCQRDNTNQTSYH
ncbi:IS66 family insertion sequence element accessory protein TnpA [Niallia sp. JL1B1071]|uniref:IS66 family insertion sequence element accessory protein TnpA n=1 Tax=Niallia tiangongensis TaxID=3237105 RepID=UPI0037DCCE15